MTDHLPECTLAPGACIAPGPHQEADGFCWKCHLHCCCDRLRACEARVEREWIEHCNRVEARTVQAARDAVAAAQAEAGDINFCKDCADWSVAAIDALRGES